MDSSTSHSEKVLENKTPFLYKIIIGIITFLTIFIIILIFNKNFFITLFTDSKNIDSKTSSAVFGVLFFVIVLLVLAVTFIPDLKEVFKLFSEIRHVMYIVIYTIFLILFFSLMPKDILNNYAFIITPVTILITILVFYKGFTVDFIESFNVNYERIKTIILFLCLNTLLFLYYKVDPGGYINKYFGYSIILTILLSFFSFLYLIILLSLPDRVNTANGIPKNFLENFSKISVMGSISFIIFLIIITIGITLYPGGFLEDTSNSTVVIILLILAFIFWTILLVSNLFTGTDNNNSSTKMNIFKKSLLAMLGLTISGILIAWLVYNIQHYSGQSGTISLILNVIIVALVLTLFYRTLNVKLPSNKMNVKKNSFFNIIINLILYIPCLLSGFFSTIFDGFSNVYNKSFSNLIILLSTIVLIIFYIFTPVIYDKINLQGGKLLLNEPVYTNNLHILSSYEKLNGSNKFNYQYGLSFWVYIDANPPNTNSSYIKYTSLLNYGNKPNILYKASTNTLLITILNDSPLPISTGKDTKINEETNSDINEEKDTEIIDGKAHRIIYKNKNFLLQKWNNIVINYNGGTLDIFLNNELVKSSIEVVPYMTLDNLTVGKDGGINGGICNVVYFDQPLTRTNMYFLYTMVKDKTPPITNQKVNIKMN